MITHPADSNAKSVFEGSGVTSMNSNKDRKNKKDSQTKLRASLRIKMAVTALSLMATKKNFMTVDASTTKGGTITSMKPSMLCAEAEPGKNKKYSSNKESGYAGLLHKQLLIFRCCAILIHEIRESNTDNILLVTILPHVKPKLCHSHFRPVLIFRCLALRALILCPFFLCGGNLKPITSPSCPKILRG